MDPSSKFESIVPLAKDSECAIPDTLKKQRPQNERSDAFRKLSGTILTPDLAAVIATNKIR